jgi:hypothetical protein
VVRFAYATDPGVAKIGWFIDNLVVTVDGKPIYTNDFESKPDELLFPGGCKDEVSVASRCTKAWQLVNANQDSPADHGYYLEMRDRSGFDFDGKKENDRDAIGFSPGLLLTYTDEAHGYGNAGTDDPPAQSPLDARPQPGNQTPTLNDAAFTVEDEFQDRNHVDNYEDPSSKSGNWEFHFNCLSFKVLSMAGDDAGPDSGPGVGGDLVGEVKVTTAKGCAAFDYGKGAAALPNNAPSAVATAKVRTAKPGQVIAFDASQSRDDRDAPTDLTYAWTFGDGATASGDSVRHSYAAEGTYTSTVRVTDRDGASSTDSVTVVVRADAAAGGGGGGGGTGGLPATGASSWVGVWAVVLFGGAVALRRSRRGA